ncbi:MAG TPA: glutamate 5-kinase [Tepidisphaeraceae bacterium]|jgi:glutamate 5-kinase|nr:glutamate 5-kinase [Tepidisphaeraceae bacterium]
MEQTRGQYLAQVRSVVIKLGTQLLSDAQKQLDTAYLSEMATQIVGLRQKGIGVTIVSSGAIGAGLRELKLPKRPVDLAQLQAVAAVGQRRLMDCWAAAFAPHGMLVGQVLLTREDIDSRKRFLNFRNTIHAIHELGAIPIVNENDTVSTDELVKISFGDNDILAAMVTHALRANLLVLLTVVDGLLDADSKPVRLVESIEEARRLVRAERSDAGKGGMDSKLAAAETVGESGEAMVVANGREPGILGKILSGAEVGTLFVPSARKRSSRSRWIGAARPVGAIVIDDGAVKAVVEKNKSLLPAGVIKVEGLFERGDLIAIKSSTGATVARGLSNYSSAGIEQIRGKKTLEVRELLKEAAYDEVVHRDNLVVE